MPNKQTQTIEDVLISFSWPGLFSDAESGIHYYKYAIGSRAGFDDIYPFTETTQEQSNIVAINMKEFHEGHIYTITVEVGNMMIECNSLFR